MKGREMGLLVLIVVILSGSYVLSVPGAARAPVQLAAAACSSGQGSAGGKANSMCPESEPFTYYDTTRACNAVYDPIKCSGGRTALANPPNASQLAAGAVAADAVIPACAKNKANCECGETQPNVVVTGKCAAPAQCRATLVISSDGIACKFGDSCSPECEPASAEGREAYKYLSERYGASSPTTPILVSTLPLPSTSPPVDPQSPAPTQPTLTQQVAEMGSPKPVAGTDAGGTGAGGTGTGGANAGGTGTGGAGAGGTQSLTQQIAQSGLGRPSGLFSQGPAVALGPGGTPPAVGGLGSFQQAQPQPTPPTPPSAYYNPSTFRPQGFSPGPSYTTRDPSFFSFIPSFSPTTFYSTIVSVVGNIVSPLVSRVVVVIPGNPPSPQNLAPANQPRPTAPVPTVAEIVANARQRQGIAAAPPSGESPSTLSDAQLISTYLQLQSAPSSVVALTPRTSPALEAPPLGDSVLDAAFAKNRERSAISSGNAAEGRVVLSGQSSFEQRGTLAPPISISLAERAHPISIVQLLDAITSGTIESIRRVLAGNWFSNSRADVSPEAVEKALAPLPQQMEGGASGNRDLTSSGGATEPSQAQRREGNLARKEVFLPALWRSPNFQAPPISVDAPFTSLLPPPLLTKLPEGKKAVPSAPSTEPAQSILTAFVGTIGNFFGKVLSWFSGLWSTPPGSMSAARAGNASVNLLADPPRAVKGTRTTLYWTSSGVDTCTIFGPDGAEIDSGAEGMTFTPILMGETVFRAECLAGASSISTIVTVGIQ